MKSIQYLLAFGLTFSSVVAGCDRPELVGLLDQESLQEAVSPAPPLEADTATGLVEQEGFEWSRDGATPRAACRESPLTDSPGFGPSACPDEGSACSSDDVYRLGCALEGHMASYFCAPLDGQVGKGVWVRQCDGKGSVPEALEPGCYYARVKPQAETPGVRCDGPCTKDQEGLVGSCSMERPAISKCRDVGKWGLRWKPLVFNGQVRCQASSGAL